MALGITAVPDIKYVLGESGRVQVYQLQPGTADYVTGGYPITASQVELGLLVGGTIIGTNAAGALYEANIVLPAGSFGTTPAPSSTATLLVAQAGVQVAANTDLSGVTWFCLFLGW